MTAREIAENALHQLSPSETTAYVIGAAVLDLADAIREFAPPEDVARVLSRAGSLATPWGPATVSGMESRTVDGGVQRGEPEPRAVVHWDAGGDDSLACGAGSGHCSRQLGDVTCVACSRISDVVAERDSARAKWATIKSQLDAWDEERNIGDRVNLGRVIGQLRTLIRTEGSEVAPLAAITGGSW